MKLSIIPSLNENMAQTTQPAVLRNQNIAYQPFTLSVWDQEDLFSFRMLTLIDAFMHLPGVKMIVHDQSFDSYNTYLNFPIEFIKRIEVVRSSGSFIEGVNGYSGTINVVTMTHIEDRTFWLRMGWKF